MIDYADRLNRARKYMAENGLDGLFLYPSGDAEYLSGVRRQRPNGTHTHYAGDWLYGLWVNQKEAVYVSPALPLRFVLTQIEGKRYIDDLMVMEDGHDSHESARKIIHRLDLENGTLAIPKNCPAKTLTNLKSLFPEIRFSCTEDFALKWRMVKNDEEIIRMRQAAELTDQVFSNVLKQLKVGMTEIEVAREVDFQILKLGAEGTSFNTGIMARGKNKPKQIENSIGRISDTRMEPGTTLAFDFGLVYQGYVSDFGRTVYIGEPTSRMRQVHKLVMDSQHAAMEVMKPGQISAEELNQVSRKVIEDAGFGTGMGQAFFHRLGHGIGIDVHEYPYLDRGYTEVLQENMTFTIEPSVLIPDELWIRVEDVVRVTPQGGESLNQTSQDIIVIDT